MRTGTFRLRSSAWASMAASCCLLPSTRKTRCRRTRPGSRRSASSNAAAIMSSMLSVTDADTHLSRAFGPGCALRRAGGAADVLRLADGGGEVGDGDDLGHFLIPGWEESSFPGVLAVLRAHGDALAVALHHDHVRGGKVRVRVPRPLRIEVVRPGREVLGQPGELGAADRDAGPGPDDLLGLPEPAAGQVKGRQGPHPQGVRVLRQGLAGHQPGRGPRAPAWFR